MNTGIRAYYTFLSCLCGSERVGAWYVPDALFLSCLCGSERRVAKARHRPQFLSCLCGSERSRWSSAGLA